MTKLSALKTFNRLQIMQSELGAVEFPENNPFGKKLAATEEGVKRALLIAVQDFNEEKIRDLHGVDPDADLIRELLVDSHCGFDNVTVLKTIPNYPTLEKINKALDEFLGSCKPNDFIFLHFGGHGFHDPETNIDYYVPFDAKPIVKDDKVVSYIADTCFSFDLLNKKISDCRAKFKWVIVDACRCEQTARDGFEEDAWTPIHELKAAEGALLIQSCRVGQSSNETTCLDPNDPTCYHGRFTWHFYEGAKGKAADPDGKVTPKRLFEYVSKELEADKTVQKPIYSSKEISGGEFVFVDVSDEPRIQAKKAFEEANNFFLEEKYEQALVKCDEANKKIDEVLKNEPENIQGLTLKKKIDNLSVQVHLTRWGVHFAIGKYREAENDANSVLQLKPMHKIALALKEQTKNPPKASQLPTDYVDSKDKEYRLIKAGSFTMGSPMTGDEVVSKYLKKSDAKKYASFFDDATQHRVTLTQDFYLAKRPVTKGEFSRFVEAALYETTAEKEGSAWGLSKSGNWEEIKGMNWRNPGFDQTNEHPVVCVSYEDALAYVDWLNATSRADVKLNGLEPFYRLPTEAEWEFACRAGTITEFFWGDEEKDGKGFLNASGTDGEPFGNKWRYRFPFKVGYPATSPVGRFKPNPWGLYDMLGNVWEWTSDWYGDYPTGAINDPEGSAEGSFRVLRGGSWSRSPADCRCASRGIGVPAERNADIGVRVAFSLISK